MDEWQVAEQVHREEVLYRPQGRLCVVERPGGVWSWDARIDARGEALDGMRLDELHVHGLARDGATAKARAEQAYWRLNNMLRAWEQEG